MKTLMVMAVACTALAASVFAEDSTESKSSAALDKEVRDRAGQERVERIAREKQAQNERGRREVEAYQRAKRELADKKAAERKGMTLEEYRLDRDTREAKNAEVSLEEWQRMDHDSRMKVMREANERRALERDTKEAEKAGLSVEDYRLQRDAKRAECSLEEWKTLDDAGRRAKRKEAEAKRFLEYEQRDAAKAGLTLEEFRAKRDAELKARQEADAAERQALRAKIKEELDDKP